MPLLSCVKDMSLSPRQSTGSTCLTVDRLDMSLVSTDSICPTDSTCCVLDSGPGVTAIARSTQFLDIYGHNSLPLENQPAKSPKNQTPTWALSLMSRVLKVPDIIYLDPFVWRQATSRSSARCTSRSTKACHTPTCSTRRVAQR